MGIIKKIAGVITAFITLFFLMLALLPSDDGDSLIAFGLVFAAIFGVITFFLLFYKSGIKFRKAVECPICGKKHYPKKDESKICAACQIEDLQNKLNEIGYPEYEQAKGKIDSINRQIEAKNNEIASLNHTISKLRESISQLNEEQSKTDNKLKTATNRIVKVKEIYNSVTYAINNFFNKPVDFSDCKLNPVFEESCEILSPTITLKLHSYDVKDLRKAFRENDRQIESVLNAYVTRYTTKANQTIYKLMVLALRAELQNILYNLKYEKLNTAIESVKEMTAKYLTIACEGNQSIAGTMTKFIGEIEYLFINAVKIEYNYYVKKEKARQEQLEIKAQMRQEAEERKALELERKKVEQEEAKYNAEIQKLKLQLESDAENTALKARILELQAQLSNVVLKKSDIAKLQNGRAGNVYIISNLGSFGDKVFKIGMTRRLNPQDRVDELGSASVPFKFDVHSMIFSDDAVELEQKIHEILNSRRVNKVNLRKEFFNVSIDELEKLVYELDPTAEFSKTMIASEFRQSLSSDEIYSTDDTFGLIDEE